MPPTIEKPAAALAGTGPFTGLLMGILVALGSAPASANLLRNPSFEEAPCVTPCSQFQGVLPSSWIALNQSPDTYSDDGSYGLSPSGFGNFTGATAQDGIRWVAGWSGLPEMFGQQLSAPLAPDHNYVLSGFLREAIRADLAHPGTYQVELWDSISFSSADKLILGSFSPPIANQADWELRTLTFTAPPGADTHPIIAFRPMGAPAAEAYPGLDNLTLEVAGGPEITGVTPASITTQGGEELTFTGERLPPAFIPRLGGVPLVAPQFIGPSAYRGFAPALPPGRYDVDLWDGEGVVAASLADAVEVVEPPAPAPPPPVVIDADYAEGTARFNWFNPTRYDTIRVRDRSGAFIRELSGDETTLFVTAPRDGIELLIEGVESGIHSRLVCAFAGPADCDIPVPLGGFANPGQFEFPLYGGNLSRNPARCQAGAGGGGGVALNLLGEWSGVNGFLQAPGSVGYTVRARDNVERPPEIDPDLLIARNYANRVVTGFTLEQDSDRLQIEGYFQKLTESPGLELKGRLIHVFPADGFEDEFTFPDAPPGEAKKWHQLLYYRADRDPSAFGARACGLPIPKGDYILQIYAVNGDPTQVHYSFADDDRDKELLIAGAPCPPYPLVRVRDLTGKTTLPDIHLITGVAPDDTHIELRAHGVWFDDEGGHSVDPGDASYKCHDFIFEWDVEGARLPRQQSTPGSNVFVAEVFTSLGCFWVNLTIRDKACDRYVFRRLQVLPEPRTISVTCNTPYYSATNPVPDPRGIIAVAGLNPAPGEGKMAKPRPYSASVLVVSRDLCDGTGLSVPASGGARDEFGNEIFGDEDIEFRLAWFAGLGLKEALAPSEIRVKDLCASARNSNLRYFQIDIDDLGKVKPLDPPLDVLIKDGKLAPVLLQTRTKVYRRRNTQGGIDVIPVAPREEDWKTVGGVMMMTNRPESLTQSHWQGSFSERDQSYSFFTQAAEAYQTHFDLEASSEVPVGIVSGVSIPSLENDFTMGLNAPLRYVNGSWLEGNALADNAGEILGNKLSAATAQIEGIRREIDAATRYEWCKSKEIFSNVTEQTLFESMIFSGAIGPIPLTIWAKVGLALTVSITAQAGTVISPFRALEGGTFARSELVLDSTLDFSIPAAIRADIAFGVVGVNYKLRPHVESSFDAYIVSENLNLSRGLHLDLAVALDAQFQYCFFNFLESFLGDLTCIPAPLIPIIPRKVLIAEHIGDPREFAGCPQGGGGLAAPALPLAPDGGGGSDVTFDVEYYFPAVESSPNGRTEIEVIYEKSSLQEKPRTLVRSRTNGILGTLYDAEVRDLEPAIGFLSNAKALIAWTRSQPELAGLPARAPEQYTLPELNLLRAQDEIIVTPLEADAGGTWSFDRDAIVISDAAAEVPNPASRRVDGRAAVAGDPTREMALVAWVRIDDPEYLKSEPGTTTYYRPDAPGSTNFVADQAPTVRPHLERSAIYIRPVGLAGPIGPARRISTPGINVEPSISFSPTGNQAYCVWVHDPVHVDLIGSNRGRNLVYAVYDAAQDAWSAPRVIVPDPDASYPGLLEPSIGLKADGTGILAFTALEAGSPERDTGVLAANRLVYISRLEGGVFGPPVLIHGKCQKRVYGSQVRVRVPDLVQDPLASVFKKPDIYLFWQQGGPPGTPESSGGLMTSVLDQVAAEPSPAVVVSPPGSVRSNVVAAVSTAGIRTVAVNSGLALRAGIGGGGGLPAESGYESESTPLLPDLGIASCVLSNQFPGPGARVTAQVEVENIGFAASAAGDLGQSEVGLRAVYVDVEGSQRVAAEVPVPVIPAGGTASLELTLEQPLEPVELRVEISPNPGDANATNDVRSCAFGAPPPQGFACLAIKLTDEAATPAFQLTWKNAANYDEILLYRDGAQLASIPGGCTAYVDRDADPAIHTWEIRGRIEVSKSCRVATTCDVVEPELFRRGDVDSSGELNITDPVALLGFLFLGNAAPRCPDAADADDNGTLEITDSIFILSFLFLGGSAPPAPGPRECGSDPTTDGLESCATDCA